MSRPAPVGPGGFVLSRPRLMSGVACCPDRFPAAAWPVLLGRAAVCAGGRRLAAGLALPPPRQISGRRVACVVGPGRCMCRWAAARPRDRHTRAWRLGVVDLEARPGPATAHRHRGQALQATRRPPIGRGLLSVSYLPWSCRHPSAPRPGPTPSHHAYHSCTDTQFRMQFPHDCFKP